MNRTVRNNLSLEIISGGTMDVLRKLDTVNAKTAAFLNRNCSPSTYAEKVFLLPGLPPGYVAH